MGVLDEHIRAFGAVEIRQQLQDCSGPILLELGNCSVLRHRPQELKQIAHVAQEQQSLCAIQRFIGTKLGTECARKHVHQTAPLRALAPNRAVNCIDLYHEGVDDGWNNR